MVLYFQIQLWLLVDSIQLHSNTQFYFYKNSLKNIRAAV